MEDEKLDEIEVTPEMIEAGCAASHLYDRNDPEEWEVAEIYKAMENACRKG